jgi:beta-N-acetylhexosaminidase
MDEARFERRLLLGAAVGTAVTSVAGCGSRTPPSPSPSPNGTPSPKPAGSQAASPAASPTQTDEATLRRKIASLLVVGFRGEQVGSGDWIIRAIKDGLGGVILFDRDQLTGGRRNISSPAQVRALVHTLRTASPGRLIVSIDQEGGKISRLNPADGFPATRSEASIGAANSAATTRTWAEGMVRSLTSVGVGLNFAPVVDLNVNPTSPAIGALDRSFSANPSVVVANATVEIQAHRAAGVRTVLKHFPGLGSATGNTDFGIVDVSGTWKSGELEPFRRLVAAGLADAVMVAHVRNRQLDASRPTSLSPAVVGGLLRGQLGFRGAIVSDDMQAAAITKQYGRDQAVTMAVEAGVDLLVFANQQVYDTAVVARTVSTIAGLVHSGAVSEARIDEAVARVNALRTG